MSNNRIIVIGGGAAGLLAAGCAAENGADVLVLEKMKLPGRKIGISGKGRCNLTNTAEARDFISHFGRNGRFLHQSFSNFFSEELIQLLEGLKLPVQIERGGRVFPKSGKAVDVVKALEKWVKNKGATLKTSSQVTKIHYEAGKITGASTKNEFIPCQKVIIATGGASYPRTGSTGDGYKLAKDCGHTIIPIRPALVSLNTTISRKNQPDGLLLKNINAHLYIDGKKKVEEFGELLFTETGISGPTILTLSSLAVDSLRNNSQVRISLDFKPALSEQKLDNRLQRDFQERHAESIESVLRGLLPQQLIPLCLAVTNLEAKKLAGIITSKERKRLGNWLKNYSVDITGYGSLDDAIVTAGGINLKEIAPKTMESKIISGLYIAGELLDLHGDTGGFNLQAAFSTGWTAGLAASASL